MARQTYHLRRPPPRPSRSLHGSFSRRSTQPNLARFLSTITCRWQASQTCPNRHDAKTPDRPQQRPQTRPTLCLNSRQLLPLAGGMTSSQHVYEVRPRKDHRGVNLISDALLFGRLCYGEPDAISNAVGYAKFFSRSHDAVIRVYDDAGNVIEMRPCAWVIRGEIQSLGNTN